jgi:hypothetical protein
MDKAYLSAYDRDCLEMNLPDLQAKYPNVSQVQLERDIDEIKMVCCELNQARFKRWIQKMKHLIYRY